MDRIVTVIFYTNGRRETYDGVPCFYPHDRAFDIIDDDGVVLTDAISYAEVKKVLVTSEEDIP